MRDRYGLAAVAALLSLLPPVAAAQPPSSFHDIRRRVDLGARVTVEPAAGPTVKGTLKAIDLDLLVVESRTGDVRIPAAAVRRVIHHAHARRAGTLIGLAAGAVYGGLFAYHFSDRPTASDVLQGAGMFGGLGAAIGVGIGSLVPTATVVYRAPGATASVSPLAAPSGAALGVRVSWSRRVQPQRVAGSHSGR